MMEIVIAGPDRLAGAARWTQNDATFMLVQA